MTETRISQLSRLKPAVNVLPTNDEYEDRNAAKAVKYLVDHLWYINNIDEIRQKMLRNAFILENLIALLRGIKTKEIYILYMLKLEI